jgi:hypothetical protein
MTDAKKQITIKQHFVPQFYLRRFADDAGFLHVFNLKTKKIESPKTPKHVCYEPYYYATQTGESDEVSQLVEDAFSSIENDLAPAIVTAEAEISGTGQITPQSKLAISALASMLWLRGGYMRAQINRMHEDMMKNTMKFRFDSEDFQNKIKELYAEQGKEYTEKEKEEMRSFVFEERYRITIGNNSHLQMIFGSMDGFSNMFFGKNWRIYLSGSDKRFFTSDNPVSEWIPKRVGFYGASFPQRKHYLPLSPKIMIEMIHPTTSKKSMRRKTLYKGADEKVDVFNILTANHSQKGFLFSEEDGRVIELNKDAMSGGKAIKKYWEEFDNQ